MYSIIFHGVPQGHDVLGGAGDRYYESFYGIGDSFKGAKTVFVVEIRRDISGLCSYYSYIRPQNVVAQGGRSGSYFGMSLKVEGMFCADVYSLFWLFDKIYEEKILGTIIQRSGNTEQYTISSFADADSSLNSIAQLANSQIRTNFESDFEDIDSSFTKQYATTSVYYNLDDVNSESFFNATRIYGKVFISPEYASKDARISSLTVSDKKYQALKIDYEKQIADLQNENSLIPGLKNQLSGLQKNYETLQGQYQEIQNRASSLKSTSAALEQQLNNARLEVDRLKKSSNLEQVVEKLEPSLKELLGVMQSIKPSFESPTQFASSMHENESTRGHHHTHLKHHKGELCGFMKYLPYIVGVLLLLILLFLLWRGIMSDMRVKKIQNEKAAIEEKYEELEKKHFALLAESELNSSSDNPYTVLVKDEKYPHVSIELLDELGSPVYGTLQIGKSYQAKCTGVNQEGEWKADGFSLSSDNRKKNPISVQVIRADKATLSFYIKNEKAISIEYRVSN